LSDVSLLYPTFCITFPLMASSTNRQQDRAISLLEQTGMVRLSEFAAAGVSAATVSRLERRGRIVRLSRGLYQLPDASLDANHSLAEAAKLVPKGIVCLVSALAFHELTDTIPPRVWMAIGAKDRLPRATQPPLQFVRFSENALRTGIEEHRIEGVPVRITTPARTVVDLFRYRQRAGRRYQKSPGLNLALEGLRQALRQRKATPAEIARYANEAGIWKVVRPYLEAMTVDA
jgi:predicted transcriptional regulator of viral defense system